jgi:putative ABC transport system permease protein
MMPMTRPSIEEIRQRLRDLAADHSRILLVLLGVVWGTLSLTTVLSFGEEFSRSFERAIRGSTHDIIRFWGGATTRPYDGLPAGRWIGLVPEDVRRIEERVAGVRAASAEYCSFGNLVKVGSRTTNARVHGVEPAYGEMRCILPEAGGRFINEADERERRRVALLGNEVKEILFGDAPAVGEKVLVEGTPFTVIGVLAKKTTLGNYEGYDREKIFVPASTFRAMKGWRYVSYIVVGLRSPEDDRVALDEIYQTLAGLHRFDPEDRTAVSVYNQIAFDRETRGIVGGTRILMGIVGVLGLIVALIGVANVLFVLVEEKRREIGIQMALGARPRALLGGVLMEGLALTFSGGVLGALGSAALLALYNQVPLGEGARGYLGFPAVSIGVAIAVTVILGIAGSLAAYFPARRAAALDPVEALREK